MIVGSVVAFQWWCFGGGVESVARFGGGRSTFGLWVAGFGGGRSAWLTWVVAHMGRGPWALSRGSHGSWFLGRFGF